jgi:hypothetical protein
MIKKEWTWMYFNDDDETSYEDGIDEIPTPKKEKYNDDDYDY